jgi:NADPH:quinone reductase-like Zn-dependent oxidoreductase
MKAIVIREFGSPDVRRREEVPTPAPGPGEVLLRDHAVSVNRTLDLVVRAGKYAIPVKLPHILGVDPSGVVAAVGQGVTSPKVGDRVTTMHSVRSGLGQSVRTTTSKAPSTRGRRW